MQQPSLEILSKQPLGTAEQERQLACNWLDTAAMFYRNAEYWERRAREAENKLKEVTQ